LLYLMRVSSANKPRCGFRWVAGALVRFRPLSTYNCHFSIAFLQRRSFICESTLMYLLPRASLGCNTMLYLDYASCCLELPDNWPWPPRRCATHMPTLERGNDRQNTQRRSSFVQFADGSDACKGSGHQSRLPSDSKDLFVYDICV